MISWNKISLQIFQQIESINNDKTLEDFDKVVLTACIIFNCTPVEFEKKQVRYSKLVEKIFKQDFVTQDYGKLGKYKINYDCGAMRFGQYIEANYYLSQNHVVNAEKIIASISEQRVYKSWRKRSWINDSETHSERCLFFLNQPVLKIMGCIARFIKEFTAFNKSYKWLFGLDNETHRQEVQEDKFNRVYGWWYAAESIAMYKKITLDEVYALNIRDAFSSLAYIKAKNKYEAEQLKKK